MKRSVVSRVVPLLALALVVPACGGRGAAPGADRAARVTITHLPSSLWSVPEGAYDEAASNPQEGHANTQALTWLVHLVLTSGESVPLSIERVDIRFRSEGRTFWTETYARSYLQRLEWITGAFDMTPEYYITRVLHGTEMAGTPDLPANGAMSWVRIPFARPWFASADQVEFQFLLKDPAGQTSSATHAVPIGTYRQRTKFRLPFAGTWAVNVGNDLSTGHRRSGLNGLTSVGWDFVKLGPDGMPFRTDGRRPEDFYTYAQPVLAAAAGTVVDMRNDIGAYGVGKAPEADVLRKDGDLFSGNLVTIDHGNGEYTLTCHMLAGSVVVKVGDRVTAGQVLGRVGNSGFAGVPHIHFNLITGPKWLVARGLPSLFSDFEQIRTGGPPTKIARGNPISGWIIRDAP